MRKIGIILTCAVKPKQDISVLRQTDPNQRLECYIKSIHNWIYDGDLIDNQIPIVIIDNSGWSFPRLQEEIKSKSLEHRVEVVSYLESEVGSNEKGYYECLSIQKAIRDSMLLRDVDFVVKITGRYYVPNLIKEIHKLRTAQIIRQSKGFRCEIVGIQKDLWRLVFDQYGINTRYILERAICDRGRGLIVKELPELPIEPTKNGGFDMFVNSL